MLHAFACSDSVLIWLAGGALLKRSIASGCCRRYAANWWFFVYWILIWHSTVHILSIYALAFQFLLVSLNMHKSFVFMCMYFMYTELYVHIFLKWFIFVLMFSWSRLQCFSCINWGLLNRHLRRTENQRISDCKHVLWLDSMKHFRLIFKSIDFYRFYKASGVNCKHNYLYCRFKHQCNWLFSCKLFFLIGWIQIDNQK